MGKIVMETIKLFTILVLVLTLTELADPVAHYRCSHDLYVHRTKGWDICKSSPGDLQRKVECGDPECRGLAVLHKGENEYFHENGPQPILVYDCKMDTMNITTIRLGECGGVSQIEDPLICHVICDSTEFQCTDGACIPLSQQCDGVSQCLNGTDEDGCCPYPEDQPNASLTKSDDSLAIGSTQMYDCIHGYLMSGSGAVICQENATWSQANFQCHELINVALGRNTLQSSTYNDFHSSWAVDGDTDCANLAHTTENDNNRWWMVMFGQTAVISEVVIWNRHTCEKRLADIHVWIGAELCAYYAGPASAGERVQINCSTPLTGKNLKLRGGGMDCNYIEFLQFCEVEAIGYFPVPVQCEVVCYAENSCAAWVDGANCTCPDNAFLCDNGMCIQFFLWCDGNKDCSDGSDEPAICPDCPYGKVHCADGTCIYNNWVCDGWDDCGDKSDELGCECNGYTCVDGTCIPLSWVCDNLNDCPNNDDEQGC